MIREKLQAGRGRKVIGIAVGVLGFYLLWRYWGSLLARSINVLDAGQKIAFVAAAFSVTAYNLRTRVVDLILKIEGVPARVAQLCGIARECGRRLTNLVILFTAAAFLLGAGGFFPVTHAISKWYAALALGLFGASIVQFVYVLFAFERLERFMLDDAESKADEREANRLLGQ